MARAGEVEALMKGALHTDELMQAAVARDTGLRTARRISHVFAIDAPAYPRALFTIRAAWFPRFRAADLPAFDCVVQS
jgi:phosphotransacetylase